MKNFENGWKNDATIDMLTLGVRAVLWRSSFSGNLKPRTRNVASRELRFKGHIYIYIYSILSTIPTVASNNLVLGWNCWLTSALLHHSVNQPYVGASEIPIWFTIVVTSLRSGGKNKRHDPHNHHPCMFVRTKNWSSPQLVLKHVVNRLPVPLVNAFGVS